MYSAICTCEVLAAAALFFAVVLRIAMIAFIVFVTVLIIKALFGR